jgi:hypothetical protein
MCGELLCLSQTSWRAQIKSPAIDTKLCLDDSPAKEVQMNDP